MAATTTPSELAAATQTRRWQIFKPSLGDFLIFLTLFWSFLAYPGSWTEFNGDADTGLHIRHYTDGAARITVGSRESSVAVLAALSVLGTPPAMTAS